MSDDLATVLDALPFGVCICEAPGGRIRIWNRRAVELWGRAPEPGDDSARFYARLKVLRIDGSEQPHAESPMKRALDTGEPGRAEVVIEHEGGSRVTLSAEVTPLRDAQGVVTAAVAAFQDIAARKRSEIDSARLAAIVASADDAIISKTLDGVVTSWNRAAEELLGYTAAEAVGQPITFIIPPERLGEEQEFLRKLRRGESIDHFETERRTKDGRLLSVSLSVSPVRDNEGRVVGASKILRDNTERRSVDANLRNTVQWLDALYRLVDSVSRARTRQTVCEAGIQAILSIARADRASILVFDPSGVMRFVCWHGLSDEYRARVDGHSPWTRDARNPEPIVVEDVLRSTTLGELQPVIAREGIRAMSFVPLLYQERLLGKFMLYFDAPHVFTPQELRLARTVAQHIAFGLSRVDAEEAVDSLLRREQAARQEADAARADAERISRGKDEFLAMLAHELRNPLGVIVNAIAFIDQNPELDPDARKASGMVKRQANHLARLLDDLLDVARITSGRIELEHDMVDLRAAVNHAIDAQRHRLEAKQQRLDVALPGRPVTVHGDPVRLQQVLGNLVNNASKYTPAGGSIAVSLDQEGLDAVLRVKDDGSGIPADKLDTIFELFAQANPTLARTEGGLGIGLTLVKQIVELHGGSVSAASEGAGRGSEFRVRLPLRHEQPRHGRRSPSTATARRRRILVVEDHADAREILATTLERQGHDVLQASGGAEGIDIALRGHPEIALVDIGLPDVDGYEVARTLRRKLGSKLRLVALTGYGQPQDRELAANAGFDAHLVKPLEPATLFDAIERLSAADAPA